SNTPDSQRIEDYQEKSTAGSSQAAWRVIITNSPDKKGKEVGDTTIFVNRELKLYANLYDDKGQYKRKISVSWFWADIQSPTETGNDSIKFLGTGSSLSFKPTELDTGFIYVWASFFYQNDSTGIITIIAGQLSKLVIRDKSGRSVENVAMTTDQEIQLFAAGYDSTNYYLGNQMVTWSSRGLIPEVQLEDSVLIFSPTRPGSGKIYAFVHKILTPYPIGDSTGIITVHPGVPTGDIMLTPDPPVISADGISISKITSDPIHDAKGNTVAPKTFITVTTDFGTIISTDENITIPGIQVTTNSSGIISLELRSAKQPGIATVQATSVEGNARGQTFVTFGKEELLLLSTYSDRTEITQGQENISVSVIVKNIGLIPSFIKEVSLELFAPDSQSVTAQYQITRIDTITQILSGQTGEFNFSVNANPYADTVLVSVDGKLTTQDGVYTHFAQKHQWQVQSPPRLHILSISTLAEEVFQGQDSLVVWMQVANQGMASVNTIDARLTFWHGGQNVTADYEVRMSETNPQIIAGHRSANLTLIVRVKPLATLGAIVINGKISARDVNTGKSYSDEGADVPASWMVTLTSAEVVITSTSINCPNVNQEGDGEVNIHQPYSVEVTIRNIGGEEVKNVGVTLISSGTSIFQSDTSRVITWIPRRESHQITFELLAYSAALPALERFTARIDSATASLSGRQATIAPSLDSEARVAIRMPANLTLKLENTFLQLTLGQRFYVKAYVYNAPENARYDSSGILGIILPEGYELISSNPTQNFKENEEVCWTVRAPLVAQGPDSILVYLSQRPRDKNNPSEFALVTTDSVVLVVQTLESTLAITEVSVTEPPGAKDGILSTEQSFVVTGKIVKQKVENVYAQITIPDAYYNSDNDL
ncbi:MAG: Ig-like domain-containing protein, partial [candidate division KSB1 bacterium]|nr:Ig-like domain-containing protein [candidate division KSB1 bacterium]